MKEAINRYIVILYVLLVGIIVPTTSTCQLDSLFQKELKMVNRQQIFDQDKLDLYLSDERFIYTEAEYEENAFQSMWRRFKLWLFRSIGKGLNSDLLQYIIIAAAALMITWFLLKSDKYGIVRQKEGKEKRYVEELDIRVHEDVLRQKYSEAKEAESWREALRYAYLMSLKSMDAKNIIQWKEWKLSTDYQEEIKDTKYLTHFAKMTSYFNFGWYGKRPLNAKMFSEIEATYNSLDSEIKQG